ncbi:MAG: hypothetical protein ABL889_06315 [Terricaulis sp.]
MRVVQALCVTLVLAIVGACDRLQSVFPPPTFDGAILVVEIDKEVTAELQLEAMSEQMAGALRAAMIRYTGRGVRDGTVRIRLIDLADTERALRELAPITGHMDITSTADGVIEGRLKDGFVDSAAADLALQSIPILERRLGGARVAIEAGEAGRVLIRTTADAVPESIKRMITQQGLVTFHMVREITAEAESGLLPAGTMLVQPLFPDVRPEVVTRRPEFTGERLARANPSTDPQTGEFVLSFQFDAEGARRFCRITSEHTGQRFAILFDNQVMTAPTINEPICGGSGQISGNFTAESANELAIIMRAGALPAPFRIVEELPPAP